MSQFAGVVPGGPILVGIPALPTGTSLLAVSLTGTMQTVLFEQVTTSPGGTGTELQYRNNSAFGAVTGTSYYSGILGLPQIDVKSTNGLSSVNISHNTSDGSIQSHGGLRLRGNSVSILDFAATGYKHIFVGSISDGASESFFAGPQYSGFKLTSSRFINWGDDNIFGSPSDVALGRTNTGILEVNNGVLGTLRDVRLRNLAVNTSVNSGAHIFIVCQGASTTGQIIQGTSSQTAILSDWQNSAGNSIVQVRNSGIFAQTGIFNLVRFSDGTSQTSAASSPTGINSGIAFFNSSIVTSTGLLYNDTLRELVLDNRQVISATGLGATNTVPRKGAGNTITASQVTITDAGLTTIPTLTVTSDVNFGGGTQITYSASTILRNVGNGIYRISNLNVDDFNRFIFGETSTGIALTKSGEYFDLTAGDRSKYIGLNCGSPNANGSGLTVFDNAGGKILSVTNTGIFAKSVSFVNQTGIIPQTTGILYAVSGDVYAVNQSGARSTITPSYPYVVNTGAQVTFDLNNGKVQKCLLGGTGIVLTFTNAISPFTVLLQQWSGGNATVNWSGTSINWVGATAPTLSVTGNKIDTLTFIPLGTGNIVLGYIAGLNS